jgi:hypothetical protein
VIAIGGQQRRVSVRALGARCAKEENDIQLSVTVEDGAVHLGTTIPEDMSESDVVELREGFLEIGRELSRRVIRFERTMLAPSETDRNRDPRPRSQKVMLNAGILWACTLGVGAIGGTILGAGAADNSLGSVVTGSGIIVFGAAPLLLGALVTTIVAGAYYAGEP